MLNNRQSNNRRRGRGRGPQSGGQRGNESRIDSRARGNAPQMLEKYKNLAREAQMQGDRVMTEYYLQFADHYFRIVAESRARFEETRARRDDWSGEEGAEGEGNSDSGSEPDSYDVDQEPYADSGNEVQAERPRREPRRDDGRRDINRDRGNRQRQPRGGNDEDQAESSAPSAIDVSILPPALGVTADPIPDIDDVPAPRRRTRAKKSEAPEAAEAE